MKVFLLTLVFFIYSFVFVPKIFADENFSTSWDEQLVIQDSTVTHVVFRIALTNTSSRYYTDSFGFSTGFATITNVKATDTGGNVTPTVIKEENGNDIKIKFSKAVVGIGNVQAFTIEFDTPDIATRRGSVVEVRIPGIDKENTFSDFTVKVKVPSSFGQLAYIKPSISGLSGNSLTFTHDELTHGGVAMLFGNVSMNVIDLSYHLQNKNVFPVQTEIALPSDTNYQSVSLDSISSKPTNVKIDQDGNWLAQYSLYPGEKKTIRVVGKIAVTVEPKKQIESVETLALYTKPQKYWEVSDADIQALAKQLKTPQQIYQYVVDKLSYDLVRAKNQSPRLGAVGILRNPTQAVCLEFADLFIAIARAAGIPAREIDGFAYTTNQHEQPLLQNGDILHAWPEYYDTEKQAWIMVDPTWENTTHGIDFFNVLDFNHIAFVIKGVNSEYPVQAGAYKFANDLSSKDVHVTPITDTTFPSSKASITLQMDKTFFAGIPIHGNARIYNPSGVIFPASEIQVKSDELIASENMIKTSDIAPFGYVDIPFSYEKISPFVKKSATITILINGSSVSQKVTILPFYYILFEKSVLPWTIGGGVFIVFISIIIWLIARKSRNLSVL